MLTIPAGADFILRRLTENGFDAYVVGGCVRDSLLGLFPHDWDICTSARPEQMQAVFADCRVIETGLKHGTLTVGFIGLAECLKALIGKHHGESEEAQELGLKIVGFIREKADKKAAETKLNFSVIATPAEGLSGKFVRLDRKRFGSIEGITDKDYYTNSFHIPVYYSISAYNKIRLEAPYHAMTNGGHITYVEVDGDPVNNLEAFEDLIRAMKDMGVGYGSINHPVDRDPLCGYTGIIGDVCPRCGRHDGEGVDIEVLRKIKGYIRDVRSEEERLEAEDKMPNMVI